MLNSASPLSSTLRMPTELDELVPIANKSALAKQSGVDTLDPITHANSFAPHFSERPELTSPSSLFPEIPPSDVKEPTLSELRFLAAMETFRDFGNEVLLTLGVRISAFRQQLQEISLENLQKLKESAENAKNSVTWELLKKIANSLLSALSIVLGVSLLSTGGSLIVGGAMVASGIFSIANMLASEAGTWDWVAKQLARDNEEMKNRLAMLLPIAAGLLTWGVGLLGSANALILSGTDFLSKTALIAQTTFAFFGGATAVGKGFADSKLLWSQADLLQLKSKMTLLGKEVEHSTKSIETMLDGLNANLDKARLFVKMAIRSNQAVVQHQI